jgi:hypothetical protein
MLYSGQDRRSSGLFLNLLLNPHVTNPTSTLAVLAGTEGAAKKFTPLTTPLPPSMLTVQLSILADQYWLVFLSPKFSIKESSGIAARHKNVKLKTNQIISDSNQCCQNFSSMS